jgi:hypothetical protein
MVESLWDKMCRCDKLPCLIGQGTAGAPFKLEYADEVVLPSPNPSSYATPPVENSAPIPTLAPTSTLGASNKENCQRCVEGFSEQVGWLIPIQDMEVNKAEEEVKVVEVRSTRHGQHSRRGHGHQMQASQPYFVPGGSDGDQSSGDEGRLLRTNGGLVQLYYVVVSLR